MRSERSRAQDNLDAVAALFDWFFGQADGMFLLCLVGTHQTFALEKPVRQLGAPVPGARPQPAAHLVNFVVPGRPGEDEELQLLWV